MWCRVTVGTKRNPAELLEATKKCAKWPKNDAKRRVFVLNRSSSIQFKKNVYFVLSENMQGLCIEGYTIPAPIHFLLFTFVTNNVTQTQFELTADNICVYITVGQLTIFTINLFTSEKRKKNLY